ncbi:succinate dehydrogenase, cytochrome b556 subunit [Massilia niastensis]|uniref:succinate dehydrogenase, cytochrome b556 subunit n=1 Tax=Massilia niastensis TaxID=544911 RepID=UPI001B7FE605|nr:succinate dehydrogenase, cytochrome b556 subunit [Massilia niastensis]
MSDAVREAGKQGRPQFRNIGITDITLKVRQPPAAVVSILHRISGAALFLMLPFLLYLLQESLLSETSYGHFAGMVDNAFVKLILLGLSWAYLHHFTAGVRHLVMDMHLGLDKGTSQKTAVWVFVVSLALTALVGLKLFGVF